MLLVVVEIVDSLLSHLPNSAETAEKPLRATVLAEPLAGTVAQRFILVFPREINELSLV